MFVLAFICVHEAFVLASRLRRSSEPDSKSLSSISTTPIPIGAIFLLFCVGWGDNRKRRKSSMDRYLTDTEGFFHFCWISYWKELLDSFFEGKTTVLNRRPFFKRFSFGFKWTVVMVLSWSFWWVTCSPDSISLWLYTHKLISGIHFGPREWTEQLYDLSWIQRFFCS